MSYQNYYIYYIFNDMEKYFPNFKREEYEDKSLEELISICRKYYEEHLPVDATVWFRVNEPNENLLYRSGCGKQISFVRDEICGKIFYMKEKKYLDSIYRHYIPQIYEDVYNNLQPNVISTHRSKSVLLPVMEINLKKVGVKIVLRDNFYDWNISIESEKNIECDFKGTFTDADHHTCFCQGFPTDRIHGMYKDNHKQFTCCIDDDYKLFTFMWILADHLYQ